MKTPTLIVRLVGLYMVTTSTVGLLQLQKARAMAGHMGGSQNQVLGDMQLYLWFGFLIGLGATVFAGRLAHILTLDSEPQRQRQELSDQLLGG